MAVLDVDPRHGGEKVIAALTAVRGRLPATAETLTGGGGRHLWFALGDADLPSAVLAPGLELKAEGGTVIAPPSLHASGRRYAWREGRGPWDLAPAPVPDWLAAEMGGAHGPEAARSPGDAPVRATTEREEFAAAWRRAGITLGAGDRYYVCPFHEDHRPSLHVDADGCRWFCFGCRRGGGIGALRRLLGDDPGPARPVTRLTGRRDGRGRVSLAGDGDVDVVGESHHQDALLALTGGVRRFGGVAAEAIAELVPEPRNRADPDAVAVTIDGTPVGYLRHRDAVRLRPDVDEARRRTGVATCRAVIRGGWDRGRGDVGAFGVVLLLPEEPAAMGT